MLGSLAELSAMEALREAGAVWQFWEERERNRTEHGQTVETARVDLGEDAFAAAWAEGRAMTFPRAIAYALAGIDRT